MKKTVLFLVAVSLTACNWNTSSPYQEEIQGIDQMLTQLDSLRSEFEGIDMEKAEEDLAQIDSLKEILTGPKADMDNRDYVLKDLAVLGYVMEPYEKIEKDGPTLKKDLDYCESQLRSLRNSLLDGKLDSNQAKEYFFAESRAFNDVTLLHRKRVASAKKAMAIWDTSASFYLQLASEIDSLAQED